VILRPILAPFDRRDPLPLQLAARMCIRNRRGEDVSVSAEIQPDSTETDTPRIPCSFRYRCLLFQPAVALVALAESVWRRSGMGCIGVIPA
jgi:hypothetical protein